MKKLLTAILMFNAFISPFIIMELQKPPETLDIIEPINVDDFCGGLSDIEYRTILPEPIDISKYQTSDEETVTETIDISKPPLSGGEESIDISETKDNSEIRYDFDNLKEDDFIAEPSFYGYSYELTEEERELVERVVMHEAGWHPDYRVVILTAQCFRNDCELNGWTPSEVFKKCGYAAMSYANPRAVKAVREVFDEGVQCVPELIFCYYNQNMVYSAYHEQFQLAIDIDGNRFFY